MVYLSTNLEKKPGNVETKPYITMLFTFVYKQQKHAFAQSAGKWQNKTMKLINSSLTFTDSRS